MHRPTALVALAALLLIAAAPIPTWPYPGPGAAAGPAAPAAAETMRLPGSPVTVRQADLDSMAHAIDWFAASHPPAPAVVMQAGSGGAYPCGYCHLPDGRGRPENAALQGLPAGYIAEQVRAFASFARRAASPDYAPTRYMASVAHAVSPANLAAAAAYFSQFEPQSHTQIVETSTIPAAIAWNFVYRFDPAQHEALGQRIVEGPADSRRFELRDPETRYIAYVPEGAIARGQAIAEQGAAGGPACVTCHGAALAGIAGASPTYIVRQLLAFRARTRNDPGAAPMQSVAAHLTDAQIIDVAAFAASRRPWRLADMPHD